jgi:hypothetical protein
MGCKDFQQYDSTCIYYMYSSPIAILPAKREKLCYLETLEHVSKKNKTYDLLNPIKIS